MTVRPPTGGAKRGPAGANPNPLGPNPLEYEMMQEMAGSLGRAATLLVEALDALRAHDERRAGTSKDAGEDDPLRADLLAEACERLWFFIVQREACGLRRHHDVYDVYDVPGEVRRHMGPKPRDPDSPSDR